VGNVVAATAWRRLQESCFVLPVALLNQGLNSVPREHLPQAQG
jgi:hypothetical protein